MRKGFTSHVGVTSLRKAVVPLLAALAAFYSTWLLQLYAVAQYALGAIQYSGTAMAELHRGQ
jgi:hypothetical protein